MKELMSSYLLTEHSQVVAYLKKKYCEVLIWLESTSSVFGSEKSEGRG